MNKTSNEFAEALFSLAMETHAEQDTLVALHLVRDSFAEQPDALAMLASPAIPKEERCKALENAFDQHVPQHVMGYLDLLCRNGRMLQLEESIRRFEELYDTANRLSTAVVTSAVELSDTEKKQLKHRLETKLNRTIRLVCQVDASLLGGAVVQVDGKVIDGSLKHKLHEIKEVMNR